MQPFLSVSGCCCYGDPSINIQIKKHVKQQRSGDLPAAAVLHMENRYEILW